MTSRRWSSPSNRSALWGQYYVRRRKPHCAEAGAREALAIARFVLANIPGLDAGQPVDRQSAMPPTEQIVFDGSVTKEAYLSPNQVVYSLSLGSDVGDWDFNWIGLVSTEDVLFAVAYVPLQQKRREIPPLQTGNNLTRNFLVVFDGAQELTGSPFLQRPGSTT